MFYSGFIVVYARRPALGQQVLRWLFWDNQKLSGFMAMYRYRRAFTAGTGPKVLDLMRRRVDDFLGIVEARFRGVQAQILENSVRGLWLRRWKPSGTDSWRATFPKMMLGTHSVIDLKGRPCLAPRPATFPKAEIVGKVVTSISIETANDGRFATVRRLPI